MSDKHRRDEHGRGVGGSTRHFFTNWNDSEDPLAKKLALTLRNRAIAIGSLRGCCGHPGEPGC